MGGLVQSSKHEKLQVALKHSPDHFCRKDDSGKEPATQLGFRISG